MALPLASEFLYSETNYDKCLISREKIAGVQEKVLKYGLDIVLMKS